MICVTVAAALVGDLVILPALLRVFGGSGEMREHTPREVD